MLGAEGPPKKAGGRFIYLAQVAQRRMGARQILGWPSSIPLLSSPLASSLPSRLYFASSLMRGVGQKVLGQMLSTNS